MKPMTVMLFPGLKLLKSTYWIYISKCFSWSKKSKFYTKKKGFRIMKKGFKIMKKGVYYMNCERNAIFSTPTI